MAIVITITKGVTIQKGTKKRPKSSAKDGALGRGFGRARGDGVKIGIGAEAGALKVMMAVGEVEGLVRQLLDILTTSRDNGK
jgi:hypothetical protein